MQVGIIGLPNVGKSTIFNALTRANAAVANFPFTTIEPNTGLITVPDTNISEIAKIFNCPKITYSSIKILDIAGLVKGASRGEGLGNKFLSHIREADVIAHIVRCFYDENIALAQGSAGPFEDVKTIKTELILADIETLQRRKEKYISLSKSGDKQSRQNLELISEIISALNTTDTSHAKDILNANPGLASELNLLYIKPVIYVANLNDDARSRQIFDEFCSKASSNKIVKIYGKIENELADFPEDERQEYKKELGIEQDGLEKFILECYSMLNLITFYTANENEARAWPLSVGSRVIEAAGKIHSDMARGFIKAEIVNCRDIIKAGSMHHAREDGKVKLEGKEYIVADGDLILIKFAV